MKRLTANAPVATVLGSIASVGSRIWGAADEAVLNKVRKKYLKPPPPKKKKFEKNKMEIAGIIFFHKGNILWDMSCSIFTWMDISSGPNKSRRKIGFLSALCTMIKFTFFKISIKRRIFWYPIRSIRRKKFSSRVLSITKKSKINKQVLHFHLPSKILCRHLGVKISGPCTAHFTSPISFYPSSLSYTLLNLLPRSVSLNEIVYL